MKNETEITVNKLNRVEAPEAGDGIVAFQMVEFVINFFGNQVVSVLDTKIMQDGRQFVIDGDGFIKSGYELSN